MTEQNLIKLGFKKLKEYTHGDDNEYFTKVYQKGILQVDMNYLDGSLSDYDLSIEGINCTPITLAELEKVVDVFCKK